MVFPNKYSVQRAQDFSLSVSPLFKPLGANRSAFTCDPAVHLCNCTLELPGICACRVDFPHSSDSSDCTWGRTSGRIWKRWQKNAKWDSLHCNNPVLNIKHPSFSHPSVNKRDKARFAFLKMVQFLRLGSEASASLSCHRLTWVQGSFPTPICH